MSALGRLHSPRWRRLYSVHRIEFTLDRPRTHDEVMVGRTLEALIRRKGQRVQRRHEYVNEGRLYSTPSVSQWVVNHLRRGDRHAAADRDEDFQLRREPAAHECERLFLCTRRAPLPQLG